MSESRPPKTTPGPWSALRRQSDYEIIADGPKGQLEIATVHHEAEYGLLPMAGNAALIAAAPDLLEALKGVLRVADRKTSEFDAARAAIAKAEGHDDG